MTDYEFRYYELEAALRRCRAHAEAWSGLSPECEDLAFLIVNEVKKVVPHDFERPATSGEFTARILKRLEQK